MILRHGIRTILGAAGVRPNGTRTSARDPGLTPCRHWWTCRLAPPRRTGSRTRPLSVTSTGQNGVGFRAPAVGATPCRRYACAGRDAAAGRSWLAATDRCRLANSSDGHLPKTRLGFANVDNSAFMCRSLGALWPTLRAVRESGYRHPKLSFFTNYSTMMRRGSRSPVRSAATTSSAVP
jgi:hypothetical protein